ncbi:ZYBA0S14-01904g1_1 [Zygosaccharomyces bailii CLIB 213]|uniref:ZYBA0S14-01904g1_1 n=1 Tax=Zygosaccharomyces bailii (strain CLIB 213 / ATCC 58445 / CBS 680 / BCRC 21525 / NBRC 1098 / NCYC 1416 / NRRL Y-2227) TaxID=1333698 RepID=A0A8J2XB49_ZYGB2|nr:ZYBA0S14-01904g1_1 [Zygosaccharomyces bailii CLIB 213]
MSSKYPTAMSCMEAFDQLTACYSVGGQFRSYYRYGEFNSCQKQQSKLKFCMFHGKDPIKVQQWHKEQIEFNNTHRGSADDIWKER